MLKLKKMQANISAIIPAHNEVPRIGNVLRVLIGSNLFNELLVVDDASTDNLEKYLKKNFPNIKLVQNRKSRGKAYAMFLGVEKAKNSLIFFCDADLTGLKKSHLQDLIEPVINSKLRMTVGAQEYMVLLKKGKNYKNIKKWFNNFGGDGKPYLNEYVKGMGGERVMHKSDFLSIKKIRNSRYGIEQQINFHFIKRNLTFRHLILNGVSHHSKVSKWGLVKGLVKELNYLLSATLNYFKYIFLKIIKSF